MQTIKEKFDGMITAAIAKSQADEAERDDQIRRGIVVLHVGIDEGNINNPLYISGPNRDCHANVINFNPKDNQISWHPMAEPRRGEVILNKYTHVGAYLEFTADYKTNNGMIRPHRQYYRIIDIDQLDKHQIVLEPVRVDQIKPAVIQVQTEDQGYYTLTAGEMDDDTLTEQLIALATEAKRRNLTI